MLPAHVSPPCVARGAPTLLEGHVRSVSIASNAFSVSIFPPWQVGGRGVGGVQPLLREAGGAGEGCAVPAAPAGRHQPHPAHQILPRAAPRDPPALWAPALPRPVENRSLV